MAGKIIRTQESKAKEISMEVIDECGVIAERKNGDVIRLDYASWNGNEPKYEIRIWKTKDGVSSAGKGIGLSGDELIALRDLLNEMEEE